MSAAIVDPTTSARPPKSSIQTRWLMIATGTESGRSSSGTKSRPRIGTPNSRKKPAVIPATSGIRRP
ncbi:MAG TPA: hypothetical protein VG871_05510 [Vicinamibacterales bacterium]|nr:hypothetical protein [Vicinamibacterales bacterium]